jgi:hypothetical protein
LGVLFILAFVSSGFGCQMWVLGWWVFFWEGCSGFLVGFGGVCWVGVILVSVCWGLQLFFEFWVSRGFWVLLVLFGWEGLTGHFAVFGF